MNPVPLDSGTYNGTYKLIGGEISLDLINTVSWPDTAREHDWLDRPSNVIAWAMASGILAEEERGTLEANASDGKAVTQVHHIRNDLRDVLRPLAFDEQPPSQAVKTLNARIHEIWAHRRIDPDSHQWTWDAPKTLTELFAPVIWNAAHILTNADHTRIGHCPSCRWLFYDTTRNRSRRWCDMADCGSRDKALRYYHRTKSAGQ